MYSHGIPPRIVFLAVLLLKMAAIGLVQMLIEAAEYLDRRERGKVTITLLSTVLCFCRIAVTAHPPPLIIYAPAIFKGCQKKTKPC